MGNKISGFLNEVKIELKKVSWPTRDELVNSTIVVLVSVLILALYIGMWDFLFSKFIEFVIR